MTRQVDPQAPDPPAAPCVLVVDDDPAIRELLVDLLRAEGYRVIEAVNGAEAIDAARGFLPAVVLIDLMMPVMSGAEATHILKSDPETAAIPVLAMSAGRNLSAVVLDIPADGFVPKPFDLTELVSVVAGYAENARQSPPPS